MASELAHREIVSGISVHPKAIRVKYRTGKKEIYYLTNTKKNPGPGCCVLTPGMANVGPPLKIHQSYEVDPIDGSDDSHMTIRRDEYNTASHIDRRLALHELYLRMSKVADKPVHYPDSVVREGIDRMRKYKTTDFICKDAFAFFPRIARQDDSWRRVLAHFFGAFDGIEKKHLWSALCWVARTKTANVDSAEARRRACWIIRRRMFNPVAHTAVFERLKVGDSIIDLHPGFGSKAIACALMGKDYHAPMTAGIRRALDMGIDGILGLRYHELADQGADTLISDAEFTKFDIEQSDRYAKRIHKMIAFAPSGQQLELRNRFKPTTTVKVFISSTNSLTLTDPDHLFIW